MGREDHTRVQNAAPMMLIEMRCRACRTPVTAPVRLVTVMQPRTTRAGDQLVPRGQAALTGTVQAAQKGGKGLGRYGIDHGVVVHTQEVLNTSCYQSSFVCCGHDPHEGPNMLCRNGHLVGSFADECSLEHFAHFSLQHCECYPLPSD